MLHPQGPGGPGAAVFAALEARRPGGASCSHGPGCDRCPSHSALKEILKRDHVRSVTLPYRCSPGVKAERSSGRLRIHITRLSHNYRRMQDIYRSDPPESFNGNRFTVEPE